MEASRTARHFVAFLLFALSFSVSVQAQGLFHRGQAVVRTENFIVTASDQAWANQVAQEAERQRRDLAIHWLGSPLPKWSAPCPVVVIAGPRLGAGGQTSYSMGRGSVGGWQMEVKGTKERILDSVLPHEITHTILASHFAKFGKPVPRWADEGACTTVEHSSERNKHDHFLIEFLAQGRGLPFATMFTLKDYPADMLPLYAQGYSVVSFLLAQGGPRQFIQFLEDGLRTENWVMAVERNYGYPKIGKLQTAWNNWVSDGGGSVDQHTAVALGHIPANASLAASTTKNASPAAQPSRPQTLVAADTSQPRVAASNPTSWYRLQLEKTQQAEPIVPNNENPRSDAPLTLDPPSITPLGSDPTIEDYSVGRAAPFQSSNSRPAIQWTGPEALMIR